MVSLLRALRQTRSCNLRRLVELGILLGIVRTKCANGNGKQGWTDRLRRPSEEGLGSGAADASLTGSHAAAGLQFGVGPSGVSGEVGVGYVFAAADDSFERCELAKFGTKAKRGFEARGEFLFRSVRRV